MVIKCDSFPSIMDIGMGRYSLNVNDVDRVIAVTVDKELLKKTEKITIESGCAK